MLHRLSPQWLIALSPRLYRQCYETQSLLPRAGPWRNHKFSTPAKRPNSQHSFHTTTQQRALHSPSDENHYNTLESPPTASPTHLKKQFYALSKRYHPDLHRGDPNASARFVRLSTAWSILGNPTKRAVYDRDLARSDPSAFGHSRAGSNGSSHGARGGPMPAGSHSSAQAYGARPASGLSKRRGTFRGPPPSFYRSGGYGAQEGKRRAAAEGAERSAGSGTSGSEDSQAGDGNTGADSGGWGGGFSPGQGQDHADFEVPHFDRQRHFRRQESVEDALRRRRSIWADREAAERDVAEGTGLSRLILVSGALLFTALVGSLWESRSTKKTKNPSY